MEVKALCTRLLLKVLLLMAEHSYAQKGDAAFLRIVPTRQQFFEYETITFSCEGFGGSAKWRGVRNMVGFIPTCSNSTVTSALICIIDNAFASDSGEYWCEAGGGERSNRVNITVTAGSVILESPILPVIEGDGVTVQCRKKKAPVDLIADFHKNGHKIWTSYSGKMTIYNFSKSDEGLYKCNISGAGESPESWLAVRAPRKACHCSGNSVVLVVLRTVFTIVMVALLLVLLGLLHRGKLTTIIQGLLR